MLVNIVRDVSAGASMVEDACTDVPIPVCYSDSLVPHRRAGQDTREIHSQLLTKACRPVLSKRIPVCALIATGELDARVWDPFDTIPFGTKKGCFAIDFFSSFRIRKEDFTLRQIDR